MHRSTWFVIAVVHFFNHSLLLHECCLILCMKFALQLGIFIGYAVWLKPRGIETTMVAGAPLFSPLTFNPERRYEAWRFLGYMFIHNGWALWNNKMHMKRLFVILHFSCKSSGMIFLSFVIPSLYLSIFIPQKGASLMPASGVEMSPCWVIE